jgi:phage terminase large subunit-like protein
MTRAVRFRSQSNLKAMRKNYSEVATTYARQVLSGEIPAGKYTKLACQRHLDDLDQQAHELYPWKYDPYQATKACLFIEQCPQVKGKQWSGKKLILEPWQAFIVCSVFGWLSKSSGLRRYRTVYVEVAKGNGKSALLSAICIYMGFVQGEAMGETYSAATTREQAKIVFASAQQMLRQMPELCRRAGIEVGKHAIYQESSGSTFKPLSSDAGGIEGSTPSFTCFDELHAADSRDLFDNLSTATGKRDNSLLWIITTAGSNRAGVCFEQHEYLKKILDGVFTDDAFFGVIFHADDKDDVFTEIAWRKANPNLGVSVSIDDLKTKARKATQVASAQPAFRTKHCNQWVSTDSAWMDMQRFLACADPNLKESDFYHQRCVFGLDLAAKIDLAACVKIFWKHTDGKVHYYVFGRYWIPQARIDASKNASIKGWAIDGWLQTFPGEENDFDLMEKAIKDDSKNFDVDRIAFDPAYTSGIPQHLTKDGYPTVEVLQRVQFLSEPMKELEAAVYGGRFHYNGDPVLTWAVSNVVCHPDKNENLFPNKENSEQKIDPVSALLTGMNQVLALVPQSKTPRRTEVLQWSLEELEELGAEA